MSKNPIIHAETLNGTHLGRTVEFEATVRNDGRGPVLGKETTPGVELTVRGILVAISHDAIPTANSGSPFLPGDGAPVVLTLTWVSAEGRRDGHLDFPVANSTMVTVVEDEDVV